MNRIAFIWGQRLEEGFHPVNPVILSRSSPFVAVWLCCGLLLACAARAAQPDADIARFISAKSNQVYLASRDSDKPVPPEVWQMFSSASAADWNGASNLFTGLLVRQNSDASRHLAPDVWYPVQDAGYFSQLIAANHLKFIRLFAQEISKLVPPGGIFVGDTLAGRYAVPAWNHSSELGKQFFSISLWDLNDPTYLAYMHELYRQEVKLPDNAARTNAASEYSSDFFRRMQHDQQFTNEAKQVLAGEDVKMVNGQIQVSGERVTRSVNGLLVRELSKANPEREFYMEEIEPLNWMYPYLEPKGPVFRLRHASQDALFEETVRDNREYWQKLIQRLIGEEVHDGTTLAEVCAAAQELDGKPKDFHGDPDFLRDESARFYFCSLRSAIGYFYWTRGTHFSKSSSERHLMEREAEQAFKQCYMLDPHETATIWRYATFLMTTQRTNDAQKFVTAAQKLNPDDATVKSLVDYFHQLDEYQRNNR